MSKGWKLSNQKRIVRFLEKIEVTDKCWFWKGFINDGGYGRYKWDQSNELAHRCMWNLAYGDFDKSLDVCHKCDNTKCVNPEHLFLGTHKDNMQDMLAKKRGRRASGVENGNAKLDASDVLEAVKLYKEGKSQTEIARRLGVHSHSTIGSIIRGGTWKHVTKISKGA